MGFFFRKQLKLTKKMNLNLSKSGIGLSGGVTGARLSVGPSGVYVNAGRKGIYFRKKITFDLGNKNTQPRSPKDNGAKSMDDVQFESSHFAEPSSYDSFMDAANETFERHSGKSTVAGFCLFLWACFCYYLGFAYHGWWAFGAGLLVWGYIAGEISEKFYTPLFYELNKENFGKYLALSAELKKVKKSKKIWIQDKAEKTVSIENNLPPTVMTNCNPVSICFNKTKIFFLPDRVMLFDPNRSEKKPYASYEYESLHISKTNFDVASTGTHPRDAEVVGRTWQFAKKDGTPDLRYKENPEVPIVRYNQIALMGPLDFKAVIYVSSNDAAESLYNAFIGLKEQAMQQKLGGNESGEQSPPYTTLHIRPGVSAADAAKALFDLKSAYAKDRIKHLPRPARSLANERIEEIEKAYAQLCSLEKFDIPKKAAS